MGITVTTQYTPTRVMVTPVMVAMGPDGMGLGLGLGDCLKATTVIGHTRSPQVSHTQR